MESDELYEESQEPKQVMEKLKSKSPLIRLKTLQSLLFQVDNFDLAQKILEMSKNDPDKRVRNAAKDVLKELHPYLAQGMLGAGVNKDWEKQLERE